ncbi:hypothetical protein JJV70_15845 [Streptomyces sp. JJ66]|uniref:hypothetical protein n=1 Tax=Streptomyces sp. JJ66 TaxID=2803843 RepID=UPI001C579CEA|nr:hypothetical protein [Streptomyces sp. JJ66]MBW1603549.1 hypothetical protein [Streptomyces sp. JJ66]
MHHQPTTAYPDAYRPAPSISRLITEITQETFWARHGFVRGDRVFSSEYLWRRERTALLLRAVVSDLFALERPGDEQAANDAVRAALAVRDADGLRPCDREEVRAWLRSEFTKHETSEAPHPPNCPGGCGGCGEVMAILTYDAEGAPVHQEPVQCDRGEPADPHPEDCRCGGTGRYRPYGERGDREVCLGYVPGPHCERCGCTEEAPCPGGCWWVPSDGMFDLCSACTPARDDGQTVPAAACFDEAPF